MTEIKQYSEVLKDLEKVLNSNLKTGVKRVFMNSIKSLKNDYGQRISTKFLRNLIIAKSNRQKTKRVNYLLSKNGLITYKETRHDFKEWVLNCFDVDIIEYAINKQGKVFIKNCKSQEVSNFGVQNKSEILNFIKI